MLNKVSNEYVMCRVILSIFYINPMLAHLAHRAGQEGAEGLGDHGEGVGEVVLVQSRHYWRISATQCNTLL